MSLINQVLRDLDKRQAPPAAATLKATARPAVPGAGQRARRWALGAAATLAAVAIGGWAQGHLRWPATPTDSAMAAAPVVPPVPPMAAAPAPVAPVAETPAPTAPMPVALAPFASPPDPSAVPPAAGPRAAIVAMAAPRARPLPHPEAPAQPAAPAPAPVVAKADTRIDKRNADRTPRERAEAHYQRGVSAHQAGQIDDSAQAFVAALREDPSYTPARLAQAGVLIGQSRADEALALLRDGLAVTPQQPNLTLMLARLQADRHELEAALATLQAAAPQAMQNAEFQGVHAALLQRADRHGEAAERYSAALRLSPSHSTWWMGLGISLAAIGNADAAREAFARAKATGQLSPDANQYVDARLRQLL
jgi:MSHA biogenesis protein MshN